MNFKDTVSSNRECVLVKLCHRKRKPRKINASNQFMLKMWVMLEGIHPEGDEEEK